MPGGQTAVLEETPVANEAACIDGVIEGLEQAAQFAKEHNLHGAAFDVTCRAGDYDREGAPEERGG